MATESTAARAEDAAVRQRRVRVSGPRLDLSEIPRPRVFLSWYDESTCLVGLSIGNRYSDPVVGLDIEVTRPPRWLARLVDRAWFRESRRHHGSSAAEGE